MPKDNFTPVVMTILPVIVVSLIMAAIGGYISFVKADASIDGKIKVIDNIIAADRAMTNQRFESMEKSRAEQYQYFKEQTDDIKYRLNNIQGYDNHTMRFDTAGVWLSKRNVWIDSSEYYAKKADSLYVEIASNLECINNTLINLESVIITN